MAVEHLASAGSGATCLVEVAQLGLEQEGVLHACKDRDDAGVVGDEVVGRLPDGGKKYVFAQTQGGREKLFNWAMEQPIREYEE